MKRKQQKLTQEEALAAERIGKRMVEDDWTLESCGINNIDFDFVASWVATAIGMDEEKKDAFDLKIYKTILAEEPSYAKRLLPGFLSKVQAYED